MNRNQQLYIQKLNDQNTIKYETQEGLYGFLSNFYHSPFIKNQNHYKTNQHYFQSKKYAGTPEERLVIDSHSPQEAFTHGRNQTFPKMSNWRFVKEQIMLQGLRCKFNTHQDLKKRLMETGEKHIIEHFEADRYWSDGGDGTGKNRMGHLLMKLRDQYKRETSS